MNFIWYLLIGLLIFIVIRTKYRKYFWKARDGEKLTLKQFFKRWGSGIQGITPLQQTKTNIMGIWITITGIVAGIVVNALIRIKDMWWWITIILVGSLILTLVQFLGSWQKFKRLKATEKAMKEIEERLKKKKKKVRKK